MDYFQRMRPTDESLRNGRRTFAIVAVIFGAIGALIVLVPGFGDTVMITVLAASLVTLAGTGVQYLGQPTLLRYRIGMILTAVGMGLSLWVLMANPFVPTSA